MKTPDKIKIFRALMLEAVASCGAALPVLLSGGVDSATILAAQRALGAKPKCYSFHLAPDLSNDVRVAASMSARFGLQHRVSQIPRTEDALVADVREIIRITGKTWKTHVQCSQPFLYLASEIKSTGADAALMGMAAGSLWGDNREAQFGRGRSGDAGFRDYRRFCHRHPDNSENSVKTVAAANGVELRDPYLYEPLAQFLIECSHDEMHRPKQKYLAVAAFAEFWTQGAWYRRNSNLQIESGLRAFHDTLLQSPLNEKLRAKSVAAIYGAIEREEI